MSRESSWFGIVDLHRKQWSNLRLFNIEKVDIVGARMQDRIEEQRIGDLTMEPLRLIQR